MVATINEYLTKEFSGEPGFHAVVNSIAEAIGVINSEVRRAALRGITGFKEITNIQGEIVHKLDDHANDIIKRFLLSNPHVFGLANEEEENFTTGSLSGEWIVLYDPLDGSSNIDANVTIGTIFSILRKTKKGVPLSMDDFLKRGTEQFAAGYAIYGSSTILVMADHKAVHGYTLDTQSGNFINPNTAITIPEPGKCIYSINEGYRNIWLSGTIAYVTSLQAELKDGSPKWSARYIGSLVADFHRTLVYGGIFLYPADQKNSKGKLRLLYEGNPLSFVMEKAGGMSVDGKRRIMEINPVELHQRTPLVFGNKAYVERAIKYLNQVS